MTLGPEIVVPKSCSLFIPNDTRYTYTLVW